MPSGKSVTHALLPMRGSPTAPGLHSEEDEAGSPPPSFDADRDSFYAAGPPPPPPDPLSKVSITLTNAEREAEDSEEDIASNPPSRPHSRTASKLMAEPLPPPLAATRRGRGPAPPPPPFRPPGAISKRQGASTRAKTLLRTRLSACSGESTTVQAAAAAAARARAAAMLFADMPAWAVSSTAGGAPDTGRPESSAGASEGALQESADRLVSFATEVEEEELGDEHVEDAAGTAAAVSFAQQALAAEFGGGSPGDSNDEELSAFAKLTLEVEAAEQREASAPVAAVDRKSAVAAPATACESATARGGGPSDPARPGPRESSAPGGQNSRPGARSSHLTSGALSSGRSSESSAGDSSADDSTAGDGRDGSAAPEMISFSEQDVFGWTPSGAIGPLQFFDTRGKRCSNDRARSGERGGSEEGSDGDAERRYPRAAAHLRRRSEMREAEKKRNKTNPEMEEDRSLDGRWLEHLPDDFVDNRRVGAQLASVSRVGATDALDSSTLPAWLRSPPTRDLLRTRKWSDDADPGAAQRGAESGEDTAMLARQESIRRELDTAVDRLALARGFHTVAIDPLAVNGVLPPSKIERLASSLAATEAAGRGGASAMATRARVDVHDDSERFDPRWRVGGRSGAASRRLREAQQRSRAPKAKNGVPLAAEWIALQRGAKARERASRAEERARSEARVESYRLALTRKALSRSPSRSPPRARLGTATWRSGGEAEVRAGAGAATGQWGGAQKSQRYRARRSPPRPQRSTSNGALFANHLRELGLHR